MTRRGLLTGTAAIAAFETIPKEAQAYFTPRPPLTFGDNGIRTGRAAQRTRICSLAYSLWMQQKTLGSGPGTAQTTIACPDDFTAIRVAFINGSSTPYTITAAIARASSTASNWVIPTGSAPTVNLTFGAGGANDPRLWDNSGLPTTISVAGNTTDPATGDTSIGAVTWSDWVPCQSAGADPTNGMRYLMLRALLPNQTMTYCNGAFNGYSGGNGGNYASNGGYDIFVGGNKTSDRVTSPWTEANNSTTTSSYLANGPFNGGCFAIVQFKTVHEGICVVQTGASKMFGTDTIDQMLPFALRALGVLQPATVGTTPIGYVTLAVGGYDSVESYTLVNSILPALTPGIVASDTFSNNDIANGGTYVSLIDGYNAWARTMAFIDLVRSTGAVPIVLPPWPYYDAGNIPQSNTGASGTQSNPAYVQNWLYWLALQQQGQVVTFDTFAILGAGGQPAEGPSITPYYGGPIAVLYGGPGGNWSGPNAQGGNSAGHPNDLGHTLLTQPYVNVIRPILGV